MVPKAPIPPKVSNVSKPSKASNIVPFTGIERPMRGVSMASPDDVIFPTLATPKIDGFRAYRRGSSVFRRSGDEYRNKVVRDILVALLPEGADGEVTSGTTFQDVSKLNSKGGGRGSSQKKKSTKGPKGQKGQKGEEGDPDEITFTDKFTFHWFDFLVERNESYRTRTERIKKYVEDHPEILQHPQCTIVPLLPTQLDDKEALAEYEEKTLASGAEGVMLRRPSSLYKFGQATIKENSLLKVKRFTDAEGVIIDYKASKSNTNVATVTNLGFSKRSTKKEGMIVHEKIGSLVLLNEEGIEVCISNFDEATKVELWNKRDSLEGTFVTFKYFAHGVKVKPRHPTFVRFRDRSDMEPSLVAKLDKVYQEYKNSQAGLTLDLQ